MEETTLFFIIAGVIIFVILAAFAYRTFTSAPVGTACTTDANCNSGLICDGTLGVCRVPPNGPCSGGSVCSSNSSCVGGVCVVNPTPDVIQPVPIPSTPEPTSSALKPADVDWSCDDSSWSDSSCSVNSYAPMASKSRSYRPIYPSSSDYTPTYPSSDGYTPTSPSSDGYTPTRPSSSGGRPSSASDGYAPGQPSFLSNGYTPTRPSSSGGRPSSTGDGYTPTGTSCSESEYCPITDNSDRSHTFQPDVIRNLADGAEIKDIVMYKGVDCILKKNGFISLQNKVYLSSLKLERIEAIKDHLIGIASGSCYIASISDSKLSWKRLMEFPSQVVHTCVTRSGSHLWVQSEKMGYLYDSELQLIEKCEVDGYRRNYGLTTTDFINSMNGRDEVEMYAGPRFTQKSARYTVYSLNGGCLVSPKNNDRCRDIRITNSGIYYII